MEKGEEEQTLRGDFARNPNLAEAHNREIGREE